MLNVPSRKRKEDEEEDLSEMGGGGKNVEARRFVHMTSSKADITRASAPLCLSCSRIAAIFSADSFPATNALD